MSPDIGDSRTLNWVIVIASNRLDRPLRDGRIVECRHEDGSPPYVVEWFDTGQTGPFFPGTDAHVQHLAGEIPARQGEAQPARHNKTWRVEVRLFESGGDTTAHAALAAEVPGIEAKGSARRHPLDADVPEIGDEVAVARALRRLSDRLLGVASHDIAILEGHPEAP